jgi:hypothetical protein
MTRKCEKQTEAILVNERVMINKKIKLIFKQSEIQKQDTRKNNHLARNISNQYFNIAR